MSNPLLQMGTPTGPVAQTSQNALMAAMPQAMPQLKQMAEQIKGLQSSGGNMSQLLGQTLGQSNPMFGALMGGQNPQDMVRAECEKQGINFDEFMSQIQQAFNG